MGVVRWVTNGGGVITVNTDVIKLLTYLLIVNELVHVLHSHL
jgi:hypothetical protein